MLTRAFQRGVGDSGQELHEPRRLLCFRGNKPGGLEHRGLRRLSGYRSNFLQMGIQEELEPELRGLHRPSGCRSKLDGVRPRRGYCEVRWGAV